MNVINFHHPDHNYSRVMYKVVYDSGGRDNSKVFILARDYNELIDAFCRYHAATENCGGRNPNNIPELPSTQHNEVLAALSSIRGLERVVDPVLISEPVVNEPAPRRSRG